MQYVMDFSLLYPMFAMVVLTFLVGAITLRARIRGAQSGDVKMGYFKTMKGEAPDYITKPVRHFNNLFETPTLFYTVCLAAMITQTTGVWMQSLAWVYVVFRCAHAYIHIGPNKVIHRMWAFLLSFVVILVMWLTVLVKI